MQNRLKKVLYIEDDLPSRLMVRKLLTHPSLELYEAEDGISGLHLAEKILPDIILMDINLPDISGTELATKIKSLPTLKETIIVALTAMDESKIRDLSLVAGCDGYLSKPLDVANFQDQVFEFLQGKRERLEEAKQESFRVEYQQHLVNRLTDKIEQLQQTNQLLQSQTGRLKIYSRRMETLVNVINKLQLCDSIPLLMNQLVQQICKEFKFDRCAFLEVDYENMKLRIKATCGFEDSLLENLNVHYDHSEFKRLFSKSQILLFPSLEKLPDSDIKQTLQKAHAEKFIFGILGTPDRRQNHVNFENDIRRVLASLIPTMYEHEDTDIALITEQLREYFSSDIFHFGGYLFMDHRDLTRQYGKYDIKILETLLRTASLLYQNLHMREQLKELFIRAEKDAITDHLTGLFNYRYFTTQLLHECNRAQRHNSRFSLLMLDLDLFKTYNDSFGHQAGNLVLKKIARLLYQNTRRSDIVFRYGGEEFAIICPELKKSHGKKIAEKLCKIIANTPFPQEEHLPHKKITISIGVASFPEDAQTPQKLVQFADSSLYKAKQSGRNQVQLY